MNYRTIKSEVRAEYEIRRSVFISSVKRTESVEEALEFVKKISKEFSDATHNCYAFLLKNGEQKFSDAGEPQGTAGTPILQTIKNNELTDITVVVTRYFGGIKLGASGLVSSYAKSADIALKQAEITLMRESYVYEIETGYSDFETMKKIVYSVEGKVVSSSYGETVKSEISVPVEKSVLFGEKFSEAFNGKTVLAHTKKVYESY